MTYLVKNIASYILIIVLILTVGCEKKIPFSEGVKKPKLVVNDEFSPMNSWSLHVSNSRSVLDQEELISIENADVKIFENGNFIETLETGGSIPGVYYGTTTPVSGNSYRVEVNAPDYDPVESTSNIPGNSLIINDIDTIFIEEGPQSRTLKLSCLIEDNHAGDDYYGISIQGEYIDDVIGSTIIKNLYISSTDLVLGGNDEFYDQTLIFDDLLFDQGNHMLGIDLPNIDEYMYDGIDSEGNPVYYRVSPNRLFIRTFTYSNDVYQFRKSIERYNDSNGDPFAQPTQVYTNVDGGYGIFGGFNEQIIELEL